MRVCLDARVRDVSVGGARQVVIGVANGLSGLQGPEEFAFLSYADQGEWLAPHLSGPATQALVRDVRATRGVRALKRAPGIDRLLDRTSTWRAVRRPDAPASDGTVERLGADVVHFLLADAFLTAVPSVYQVHDLQYLHLPDLFPVAVRLRRERRDRIFCEQANVVAVMSQWSKSDVVARLAVPPEKVVVVPWASTMEVYEPSPAPPDVLRDARLSTGFVLYPAQAWPHKNHLRLLEALAELRDAGLRVPLVMTGAHTRHTEAIHARVRHLRLGSQVLDLGFVPGPVLVALYASATAVVFPSLFEGFGIPVVEAMSLGTALACASVCNLPELVRDAAVLFDPHDTTAMASAIRALWTDAGLRQELAARGRMRSIEFSWARTAQVLRAVYRRVAGDPLSAADARLLTAADR